MANWKRLFMIGSKSDSALKKEIEAHVSLKLKIARKIEIHTGKFKARNLGHRISQIRQGNERSRFIPET